MTENNRRLKALIGELNKRRDNYQTEGLPLVQDFYKIRGRKQRKPDVFVDSSFLFIRSYDGDNGNRPLPSGLNFWNSPDISFTPMNGTGPLTSNELQAGQSYLVRCRLYNRRDVTVPFPKVEFFLTNPTLGFDTRFATYLGVTQMNGLLLANTNGEAQFLFTVPPEESGHKCFFARTYSFSPLDKPNSVHALDPVTDRHIGQKNLNILPQGAAYNFNVIHMPNTEELIQFLPVSINEIIGYGLPILGKFQFKETRSLALLYRQEVKVTSPNSHVQIKRGREGYSFISEGEGPNAREQARLYKAYLGALKRINAGKAKPSEFKELFAEHRTMEAFIQKTSLYIQFPSLGLSPNEAVALNIVNINKITGEIKGGISLVITG